jgi:hypothetical protein
MFHIHALENILFVLFGCYLCCSMYCLCVNMYCRGKAMATYPQELAQDAVRQSHTSRLTGFWFLLNRPNG